MAVRVKITPNDKGTPIGQLASAELHFEEAPLAGLKLIGFGVWAKRNGGLTVTFPARQYAVGGERRSFAILRPIADADSQVQVRDLIIQAYQEYAETSAAQV